MMMSDDKVGGWVKKGQNHDDVILECPLTKDLKFLQNWPCIHLYKALCLFLLSKFPCPTSIPCPRSISESRVHMSIVKY